MPRKSKYPLGEWVETTRKVGGVRRTVWIKRKRNP
jgi:hypothetical protein